ncbi:MAG TPA: histidine kinase [Thermoanaerobaculia bacterium]|jgi:signal transduction histidine kinase
MSRQPRILTLAGLVAWLAVGLPVMLAGTDSVWRLSIWLAAYASFAVAFAARTRTVSFIPLGVEVVAVLAMVLTLCNGFEGTLLVLVAAQLGLSATRRVALPWIAIQNALLFTAIAIHWAPRPAVMLTPPYLGFQLFAFVALELMRREAAANAQRGRLEERLRIAQELHDAVGHHLTAMSLNLEVAAHQTTGEARENVRTAQSLARLVLSDVREIVATTRPAPPIDLRASLEQLAAEVPSPRVHLELPDALDTVDADRAHVVFRCTQEIVTNAMRHAKAGNLWIELRWRDRALEIRARDDGRGTRELRDGSGLTGMRRRLADLGGSLQIATGEGAGFELTANVPLAEAS